MFNTASTSVDDKGSSRSSGIRRLTPRKLDSGPKITRLGKKVDGSTSGNVVRKLGNKSPKSDHSLAPSENGSEEWSEIGSEELNAAVAAEPAVGRHTAYKCGPVDKDEVMSRLRAQPRREPLADWVIEEQIQADIIVEERTPTKKINLDEIAPPPQESEPPKQQGSPSAQWNLRNSWLANVSRSVASLTAKMSQNVTTALDNPDQAGAEDLKSLVHQRLENIPQEERIKSGRKYLYEAGIDDSFRARHQYPEIKEEQKVQNEVASVTLDDPKKTKAEEASVLKVSSPKRILPETSKSSKIGRIDSDSREQKKTRIKEEPAEKVSEPSLTSKPSKIRNSDSDIWDDWSGSFETVESAKSTVTNKTTQLAPKNLQINKKNVHVDNKFDWEDDWNRGQFEPMEIIVPKKQHKNTMNKNPPKTMPPTVSRNEEEVKKEDIKDQILQVELTADWENDDWSQDIVQPVISHKIHEEITQPLNESDNQIQFKNRETEIKIKTFDVARNLQEDNLSEENRLQTTSMKPITGVNLIPGLTSEVKGKQETSNPLSELITTAIDYEIVNVPTVDDSHINFKEVHQLVSKVSPSAPIGWDTLSTNDDYSEQLNLTSTLPPEEVLIETNLNMADSIALDYEVNNTEGPTDWDAWGEELSEPLSLNTDLPQNEAVNESNQNIPGMNSEDATIVNEDQTKESEYWDDWEKNDHSGEPINTDVNTSQTVIDSKQEKLVATEPVSISEIVPSNSPSCKNLIVNDSTTGPMDVMETKAIETSEQHEFVNETLEEEGNVATSGNEQQSSNDLSDESIDLPIAIKVQIHHDVEELQVPPKFSAEEKLKIEDRIKRSLNAEIDKFYEQEVASGWNDDEEWSPESAPQADFPIIAQQIPATELHVAIPHFEEVYSESESDSDEEEDEDKLKKPRKQTKQKSVQECIELLIKNRAELEQRKAHEALKVTSEVTEEPINTVSVNMEPINEDLWGWEAESGPDVVPDVQILETPVVNLLQSLNKVAAEGTVEYIENIAEASWEDEEELCSLVVNAVHHSPVETPKNDSCYELADDIKDTNEVPSAEPWDNNIIESREQTRVFDYPQEVSPSVLSPPDSFEQSHFAVKDPLKSMDSVQVNVESKNFQIGETSIDKNEVEPEDFCLNTTTLLVEKLPDDQAILDSIEELIIPTSTIKFTVHTEENLSEVLPQIAPHPSIYSPEIHKFPAAPDFEVSIKHPSDSSDIGNTDKTTFDHTHTEDHSETSSPVEAIEPVFVKKRAYRCGDDDEEPESEIMNQYPPLHAVRLDPIGASHDEDILPPRKIEGQDSIEEPKQMQINSFDDSETPNQLVTAFVSPGSGEFSHVEAAEVLPHCILDKSDPIDAAQKPLEEEDSWNDWDNPSPSMEDARVEAIEPQVIPIVNAVHFQENERLAFVQENVDEDDGDGWDDWGEDSAEVEGTSEDRREEPPVAADGDGWDDPAPRPPLVNQAQSCESAEDGWDDWGDMDGARGEDMPEPEIQDVVQNEVPVEAQQEEVIERQQLENIFSRLENKNQNQWNWKSNFGLSLLANASKNVANLTAQVSQNLSTALDAVPQPEEMAKIVKQDERIRKVSVESQKSERSLNENDVPTLERSVSEEKRLSESKKIIALNNLVSGVTQISSKVITGGLDTLEGIGKKTFNIIQENDGIISKTKQFVLDLDRKGAEPEPEQIAVRRPKLPQFETIFDDYHGLVHFEALKLLSKQSQIKLEMLLSPLKGETLVKFQETILEVEELCDIPDSTEMSEIVEGDHTGAQLEDRLSFAVRDLEFDVRFSEMADSWKRTLSYLQKDASTATTLELYEKSLCALAEFTSLTLAKLQLIATDLIVCKYHSAANEADALTSLVKICFWHINGIATKFNRVLNSKGDTTDDIKTMTTNTFLEASNANNYIRKSLKLFVPILQIGTSV